MKKIAHISIVYYLTVLFCSHVQATIIIYDLNELGGSQFEYEYTIVNDSLSVPIEEFTIWFDVGSYDNLIITTQESLASQWDEIILEKTGFGLPIGYDALSLSGGIPPNENNENVEVSGFSVAFDWFGAGVPGSQYYEIIDPVTFVTIDDGYTIPEPATVLLLVFGSLALRIKRRA